MAKLRIGLTISGAVSLGSYEGGALAALLVAVQAMGPEAVVIDAITGASAGAITAVLAAQTLVRGLQPIDAMAKSWVDLPALDRLATHDMASLLSGHVLSEEATKLLGPGGVAGGAPRQPGPVRVAVTMTSLGGYHYRIAALMKATPVDATTYLDWADFTFDDTSPDAAYLGAAEMALASAANALGFPPKLVVRSPEDRDKAIANGVLNPPNPHGTWYTDGGTVDNEPFGRLLDLARDDDPRANRLLLLVHPSSDQVGAPTAWDDPTTQPNWTRTGLRSWKIQGTQSIYEDLRRLEKTNTRIVSLEDLAHAIDSAVTDASDREAVRAALGEFVAALQERKTKVNEVINRRPPAKTRGSYGPDVSLADALTDAIGRATGLDGKRPAKVEIVTPALDPSHLPADELLAGEKLGHFFGFTGERFRRNDFALGYRNMRTFLAESLGAHGVADEVTAALPAVDAAYDSLGWDGYHEGNASFSSLHFSEKMRLLLLGVHAAHVVQHAVRHWTDGFPVSSPS
jgi:predicted acylesterase/phospholipase RssA